MSLKDTERLQFNQYHKFDKEPFIICADLEFLIENTDLFKTDLYKIIHNKASEHIPLSFLMSTITSFKSRESNHAVYRGKCCMKYFVND